MVPNARIGYQQPMTKLDPAPDESLDRLNDSWSIFQLKKGHRFSTDDLACAWRASIAAPRAATVLDLGSGIGSVGLSVLYLLGEGPTLFGVEAQEVSVGLARRSIALNQLQHRVSYEHVDLREADRVILDRRFDLITGSPPYMPLGKGLISPHPQRAACRAELRGSVLDYSAAARRYLAPGGRFTVVMPSEDPRVEQSFRDNDLVVVEKYAVYFRADRTPLISVWTTARAEDGPHPPTATGSLTVRSAQGEWTPEYFSFRAHFGIEGTTASQQGRPPSV